MIRPQGALKWSLRDIESLGRGKQEDILWILKRELSGGRLAVHRDLRTLLYSIRGGCFCDNALLCTLDKRCSAESLCAFVRSSETLIVAD